MNLKIRSALFLLLIVMACGPKSDLPEIRYGRDTCDWCGMLISEERFAAMFRAHSKAVRRFDDFGCAILHRAENQEAIEKFWVKHYKNSNWLEMDQSFFVHSEELITPMGNGVVALSSEGQAKKLAKTINGQIFNFDQVSQFLLSKRR